MRPAETATRLAAFAGRCSGTDAERRAAQWLISELREDRRDARPEPFWCRPNWGLAHAWHVAFGLAGSLVSVSSPKLGGIVLLVALLSVLSDAITGRSIGRRLTRERASQNVLSASDHPAPVRLIVTANYDAGRTGLVYRLGAHTAVDALRRSAGKALPLGWLGWIVVLLGWLLLASILRSGGARGTTIAVVQLIPTVTLVLALALLLELASAGYSPGAGDDASGAAVALALVRALADDPPRNLAVELVLQGAGDGGGIGLRRHLRARRQALTAANAVVIGIAACGCGSPRWWVSDGPLISLSYSKRLREMSASIGRSEMQLGAQTRRGHGATPAFPARLAGLPSITIGSLDDRNTVPRSHQATDTPQELDPAAIERTLAFALALVDAIDADLARAGTTTAPTRA